MIFPGTLEIRTFLAGRISVTTDVTASTTLLAHLSPTPIRAAV